MPKGSIRTCCSSSHCFCLPQRQEEACHPSQVCEYMCRFGESDAIFADLNGAVKVANGVMHVLHAVVLAFLVLV